MQKLMASVLLTTLTLSSNSNAFVSSENNSQNEINSNSQNEEQQDILATLTGSATMGHNKFSDESKHFKAGDILKLETLVVAELVGKADILINHYQNKISIIKLWKNNISQSCLAI